MDTYPVLGGIEVRLDALDQRRTYGGLIEGLPTSRMNQQRIHRLAQTFPDAHIAPVTETPIDVGRPYPFGTPSSLPAIQCVGNFEGPGLSDPVEFRSQLTIIWFQDAWAMPFAPWFIAYLAELDWRGLAGESER